MKIYVISFFDDDDFFLTIKNKKLSHRMLDMDMFGSWTSQQ